MGGSNCPLRTAFPLGVMHKRMTFTESELDVKFHKHWLRPRVLWGGQMKEGAIGRDIAGVRGPLPCDFTLGAADPRDDPCDPEYEEAITLGKHRTRSPGCRVLRAVCKGTYKWEGSSHSS